MFPFIILPLLIISFIHQTSSAMEYRSHTESSSPMAASPRTGTPINDDESDDELAGITSSSQTTPTKSKQRPQTTGAGTTRGRMSSLAKTFDSSIAQRMKEARLDVVLPDNENDQDPHDSPSKRAAHYAGRFSTPQAPQTPTRTRSSVSSATPQTPATPALQYFGSPAPKQ